MSEMLEVCETSWGRCAGPTPKGVQWVRPPKSVVVFGAPVQMIGKGVTPSR